MGVLAKELADCPVIRLVPTEDKVAILEARVNQQSELIALLKQRADDTLHEVRMMWREGGKEKGSFKSWHRAGFIVSLPTYTHTHTHTHARTHTHIYTHTHS